MDIPSQRNVHNKGRREDWSQHHPTEDLFGRSKEGTDLCDLTITPGHQIRFLLIPKWFPVHLFPLLPSRLFALSLLICELLIFCFFPLSVLISENLCVSISVSSVGAFSSLSSLSLFSPFYIQYVLFHPKVDSQGLVTVPYVN